MATAAASIADPPPTIQAVRPLVAPSAGVGKASSGARTVPEQASTRSDTGVPASRTVASYTGRCTRSPASVAPSPSARARAAASGTVGSITSPPSACAASKNSCSASGSEKRSHAGSSADQAGTSRRGPSLTYRQKG